MKRTVIHTLRDLQGEPVSGGAVTFSLDSGGYDQDAIYLQGKVIVFSDDDGVVETELWVNEDSENQACYTVHLPDCTKFDFILPAGDTPITLMALKQSGISWDDPTFLPTIEYLKENARELELDVTVERSYTHIQTNIAVTWYVNHNLGKYPSVTVVDELRGVVEGVVIDYQDLNNLTITMNPPMAGEAYLN